MHEQTLRECDDDELRIGWDRHALGITEKLHASILAAGGKDGVGDVPLPIGVGEAQVLGCPDRKVREHGWQRRSMHP